MIIVDNFVFITPAKTGSSSLEKFFEENRCKPKYIKHKHDIHIPVEYQHYKKVLLVRNPYDWFISHYYWSNTTLSVVDYSKVFLKYISEALPHIYNPKYEEPSVNTQRGRTLTRKDVRALRESNPELLVDYIATRLEMFKPLSICKNIIKPDYIIRLETIQKDLHSLNFDATHYPHDNPSKNRPATSWQSYYTPELLSIIGPFLAQEAEALGYPILE